MGWIFLQNPDEGDVVALSGAGSLMIVSVFSAFALGRIMRLRAVLQVNERDLCRVLETFPLMVCLIREEDERIVGVNRQIEERLGRRADKLIGRTLRESGLICADDWAWFHEKRRSGSTLIDEEMKLLCVEGREVDCVMTCREISKNGMMILALYFKDVTGLQGTYRRRNELENELKEREKLQSLGNLAGGVAHDFNNILQGVMAAAELSRIELGDAFPGVVEKLGMIESQGKRAGELASMMLDYSGNGSLILRSMPLKGEVVEACRSFRRKLNKNVVLQCYSPEDECRVSADRNAVSQMLFQLLQNAMEAVGDVGTVKVHLFEKYCEENDLPEPGVVQGDNRGRWYAVLSVSDDGHGMSDSVKEHLFDPFYSTKFYGRGLGLSAVLGIVKGHKGVIHVESEPGNGAVFTVYLPLVHQSLRAVPKAGKENVSGENVLVVDDEEVILQLGRDFLVKLGCSVLTAANGEKGVELFARQHDSLTCVFLDIRMHGMGGLEVYDRMRIIDSSVPIFLCSGYTERQVLEQFAGRAIAGFIQKPFSLDTLKEHLDKLEFGARKRVPAESYYSGFSDKTD